MVLVEEVDSYERAFQLSYAAQLSSHIALGGSIKLVQTRFEQPQGIPTASARAWGFDIGILVQNLFSDLTYSRRSNSFPEKLQKFDRKNSQGLSFGLALLNTGPDGFVYVDDGQKDPLPQILRLGLAFKAMDTDEIGLLLACDVDKILVERDATGSRGFVESWFKAWDGGFDNLHFGAEIDIYHLFAVRFGRDEYLNFASAGGISEWTFGLGVGPEWARVNLVRRSFPIAIRQKKWVLDVAFGY